MTLRAKWFKEVATEHINRETFFKYVATSIGKKVNFIKPIIQILLEELEKDILSKKPIKIKNFVTIHLATVTPRTYDSKYGPITFGGRRNSLRFKLSDILKIRLIYNLDLEKTYKNDIEDLSLLKMSKEKLDQQNIDEKKI